MTVWQLNKNKNCVRLSEWAPHFPILERYPSNTRCGDFCLLRVRPGPVHPSLVNLVKPGSPSSTISTPRLERTLDRHGSGKDRTPNHKPSGSSSLQDAGLQEHATVPGENLFYFTLHIHFIVHILCTNSPHMLVPSFLYSGNMFEYCEISGYFIN